MTRALPADPPESSMLLELRRRGCFTDCYALEVPAPVTQAQFVEAFYTTPLFKAERFILKMLVARPSTDQDAKDLATGTNDSFAVWDVTRPPRASRRQEAGRPTGSSTRMTTGVRSVAYPSAMQVEHRITVAASSDAIFRIYADVEQWPSWDPDTRQASLQGPFQVGSRGRLTPAKGSAVPMLLTEVVPGKCFTVESKIPLFRMVFEHELIPAAGATEVVHRVTFSGFLSFILGPILIKQLNVGLLVTLRKLKALAETRGAARRK